MPSSEERQLYQLRLASFFESMAPGLAGEHCWKIS